MTRHIHIHLTTGDAGKFEEHKHRRNKGKFSKVSGSAAAPEPSAQKSAAAAPLDKNSLYALKHPNPAPVAPVEKPIKSETDFSKRTLVQVKNHFTKKYGVGFQNGTPESLKTQAVKDLQAAQKKLRQLFRQIGSDQNKDHPLYGEMRKTATEVGRLKNLPGTQFVSTGLPPEVDEIDIENTKSPEVKKMRSAMKHVDNAFAYLQSKHGVDMQALTRRYGLTLVAGSVGENSGLSWQSSDGRGGNIAVSPETIGDPLTFDRDYRERMKAREQQGYPKWTACDDGEMTHEEWAQSVIVHETAHAIGLNSKKRSPEKLQAVFEKLYPMFRIEDRIDWVKYNISEYASTNMHETEAELVAMVFSPKYESGSLPAELENHARSVFDLPPVKGK